MPLTKRPVAKTRSRGKPSARRSGTRAQPAARRMAESPRKRAEPTSVGPRARRNRTAWQTERSARGRAHAGTLTRGGAKKPKRKPERAR